MTVIDDSYNANPDSVRAAIDVLAGAPGRTVLVLGDMGEVGDDGPDFHSEIGRYARERGIGSREFYPALHTTPALRSEASCPVAETVAHQGLWLPSSLRVEESDVDRVCTVIAEFFRKSQL